MKKCFACGNDNPDQMAFCLECGKPLSSPPTGWNAGDQTTSSMGGPQTVAGKSVETRFYGQGFTINTDTAEQPPGTQTGIPAPKKSRKGLVIGLVAAAVAVLGMGTAAIIGGYLYLSSGALDGNRNAAPTNSNSNTNSGPNATPTPVASFTPPTEATKTATFTVNANSGWQLSDIDTVPLEDFKTTATGLIDLSGLKGNVGPKGITDQASKSRRLVADFPTGALLMRTRYADGNYSNVQAIKSSGSWQNFQDERGRIEFCVNDNAPQNNGGQFTVTVKMTKVPKPKN